MNMNIMYKKFRFSLIIKIFKNYTKKTQFKILNIINLKSKVI